MNKLSVENKKILKNITIKYVKIVKQRFEIDVRELIKDLNKHIKIEDELSDEEYKIKKYLEDILENDIHILNNMESVEDIKRNIDLNINVCSDSIFIKKIINNYIKMIGDI